MFWALFDGLSSWAKENKPNILIIETLEFVGSGGVMVSKEA